MNENTSLPEGWHRFSFDQIAENIREPGQPTSNDSSTYIGLEHLDSGSLGIRRRGIKTELKGQKLRMKKGDILFAKRNAYLRRVAIAPYDGFFSAHGMVLRAKPDVVLPEILPFFMMSNEFMERAEKISVGSLSPTINWSTLKKEQFILPPLEQQKHIATLLWAAEDCIVKNERFIEEAERAKQVLIQEWFRDYLDINYQERNVQKISPKNPLKFVKIGKYCDVKGGIQKTKDRLPKNNPVRYLTVIHVQRNFINFNEPRYFEVTKKELDELRLFSGDILIVEGNGNKSEVGRTALFRGEIKDCIHQNHVIRIRPNKELIDPEFLNFYLNSAYGQNEILKRSMSTSGLYTLSVGRVKELLIPHPPLQEQRQIATHLSTFDKTIAFAQSNVLSLKALKTKLINQLLTEGEILLKYTGGI